MKHNDDKTTIIGCCGRMIYEQATERSLNKWIPKESDNECREGKALLVFKDTTPKRITLRNAVGGINRGTVYYLWTNGLSKIGANRGTAVGGINRSTDTMHMGDVAIALLRGGP